MQYMFVIVEKPT